MSEEDGGGAPAADVIRAAKANVRYHLAYIGWLAQTRNFLAGDRLNYADLAAAAHLSAIDYLGDVPWIEEDAAKAWYARVKSRPSFRPLLSEWLAGGPGSRTYVALHFGTCTPSAPPPKGSARSRIRFRGRYRSGCDCRCRSVFPRFPRRRRAWRHGLARREAGTPRRSARAVGGRAFGDHALLQLRAR